LKNKREDHQKLELKKQNIIFEESKFDETSLLNNFAYQQRSHRKTIEKAINTPFNNRNKIIEEFVNSSQIVPRNILIRSSF